MNSSILDTDNLNNFIISLKLSREQESFLIEKLPSMDEKERVGLLDMLKDVYLLNEEQKQVIEKIKDNWDK